MKYTYPAIFEKESEGGYSIYFPDIEGCYTQAEDTAEGIENAADALCLMMYELEKQGKAIPESSYLEDIEANDGGIVMQISCDTQYYFNRFAEMSAGINAAIPL